MDNPIIAQVFTGDIPESLVDEQQDRIVKGMRDECLTLREFGQFLNSLPPSDTARRAATHAAYERMAQQERTARRAEQMERHSSDVVRSGRFCKQCHTFGCGHTRRRI